MRSAWIAASFVLLPVHGSPAETIAFVRGGNVWVMDPDGSAQTQVTWTKDCRHPSWSADGHDLVFAAMGNLWRLTLTGRQLKRLTTTGDACQPAWRPGTSEIWYVRVAPLGDGGPKEPTHLWVVDANGGEAKERGESSDEAWGPTGRSTWRSDGRVLLYSLAYPEGSEPVFRIADGREVIWSSLMTLMPPADAREGSLWPSSAPAICPANQTLLATGTENRVTGSCGIYLYDLREGRSRAVVRTPDYGDTDPPPASRWPRWAPGTDASAATYPVPPGANAPAYYGAFWPSWSPDGRHIAFGLCVLGDESYKDSIWRVAVDGRNATLIAENADAPAWSPTMR